MNEHIFARRSPRWLSCAALVCSILLAACGNVTPGGFSRVGVDVTGDAEEPAPAAEPQMSVAGDGTEAISAASPTLAIGDDLPRGEVRVRFALSLVDQDGAVTTLDDDVRVRVDLEGRDEADAAEAIVVAATYTEMRIVFTEIRAEIESGLIVDGIPILGEIRVELQDVSLEVSRPVAITLGEGARADLLIDLNAPAWVAAVDPITRTVDPTVFASLIAVVER